jgi:hypothetical protein
MVDCAAHVDGWEVAGGCRATRIGRAQWQRYGPVRDVAIRRRQTPPDDARVVKSAIQRANVET